MLQVNLVDPQLAPVGPGSVLPVVVDSCRLAQSCIDRLKSQAVICRSQQEQGYTSVLLRAAKSVKNTAFLDNWRTALHSDCCHSCK